MRKAGGRKENWRVIAIFFLAFYARMVIGTLKQELWLRVNDPMFLIITTQSLYHCQNISDDVLDTKVIRILQLLLPEETFC